MCEDVGEGCVRSRDRDFPGGKILESISATNSCDLFALQEETMRTGDDAVVQGSMSKVSATAALPFHLMNKTKHAFS